MKLKEAGFSVFFSHITLDGKRGTEYEPYIFAALNSAKVMVVIGTEPANFNAPWVKNEWKRYLSLAKQSGSEKVLIPAYLNMERRVMPKEFSELLTYDMSEPNFVSEPVAVMIIP